MNAETLARALGGRRTGGHWMACCPSHDDNNPSLSISETDDGLVLVHCHAGCGQSSVIDTLRSRGLWISTESSRSPLIKKHFPAAPKQTAYKNAQVRSLAALRVWRKTFPAGGTAVQNYLCSRGINLAPNEAVRFHPRLKHPGGESWPGMVVLVTRGIDAEPLAVHRTFLARDGFGKAPVSPQKMMLGPCRGGAVRLAEAIGTLMIGEGIETCLAAMQATGLPAWAALSTSGLRTLQLPSQIDEVIILADGDEPGEKAALYAAVRWKREGRIVRIARAPEGRDFNDVLMARVAVKKEGAA